MAFGVFIHRADSIYDDSPSEQYQFPAPYLARAEACIGDWIIYYEPVKIPNSKGYHAVAKVQRIIPDPKAPGMHIAIIEPGSYLDFSTPVPFAGPTGPVERGLLNPQGKLSGRAQAAIRTLSSEDFNRIVSLGLDEPHPVLPRVDSIADRPSDIFLRDPPTPFTFEQQRPRIPQLMSRVVRDRAFRRVVLRAYDERCAFTGLKLINGGGRAEAEAAHIRPVEANGPDIVSNGIALSGTVHWMFDRGLISLADDLRILVSRQVNDADGIKALLNPDGQARLPIRPTERPHPHFLAWHRDHCFKQ